MKRFIVLLTVLALVSPAFATTFGGNATPSTATLQGTVGGTVSTSAATWVTSPVPPGLTATSAPFSGAVVSDTGGTLWYKTELKVNTYGVTVNVDQSFGDGVMTQYKSADLTNDVMTYNSLGKLTHNNGTVNINGGTVWVDKWQGGTVARTSSSGGYFGKSILNIGSGGAFRVTGTSANSANSGNMVMTYGNNIDSFVNVSGTGILSGVARTNGDSGTVLGGRDLAFFKGNGNTASISTLEISGSQATVEAGSLNMQCGNASGKGILRYISDAAGNISTINLYGAGANAVFYGNSTTLDFQLLAAPTVEGQTYTLINLVDATATQNFSKGKLLRLDGTVLNEYGNIFAKFGDTYYTLGISYVGGTGNDVTLTYIPEPATMALLSLGGLLVARRRRA